MENTKISKKHKNDILLTASILIVAVAVFFISLVFSKQGDYVTVTENGKTVQKHPLSSNTEVEIKSENGYNLLVIESGEAYIKSASCPDKLCVNQGRISKNGQALVCLPNKITVTVHSDEESDADFKS